jgi:hypothetical protein
MIDTVNYTSTSRQGKLFYIDINIDHGKRVHGIYFDMDRMRAEINLPRLDCD